MSITTAVPVKKRTMLSVTASIEDVESTKLTLEFACALTKRDYHDLIARFRRDIDWALFAYEIHGDTYLDAEGFNTEPYAWLVKHIVDYDDKYGHTPSMEELVGYVTTLKHDPQKWGSNAEYTTKGIDALQMWLVDNDTPNGEITLPQIAEAEPLLPKFIERARILRVKCMALAAMRSVSGKTTRKNAKGELVTITYEDCMAQIRRIVENDLSPITTAKKAIPELPEASLYGWLGDKALQLGVPIGYAYPALVGMYAGSKIRVKGKKVHPSMMIALAGDVATGKSVAIKRAEKALGIPKFNVIKHSASSDRGLWKLLSDDPKAKDVPKKAGGTFVMALTELRHMFSKMGIENSALPAALCALWDSDDDSGTADKFHDVGCQVTLSIVGGLKVKDADDFATVFGADSMHGLSSRFLIAITSESWEYSDIDIIPEQRKPAEITIPKECWERLAQWRKAKEGRGRLAEIALRWAVITEAANWGGPVSGTVEEQEVATLAALNTLDTPEAEYNLQRVSWKPLEAVLSLQALECALLVCEHQEQVRELYSPSEAINDEARCGNAIMKALEESGGSFKWNLMAKNRHWNDKYGAPMVARVRKNMIATGQITYEESGWVSIPS